MWSARCAEEKRVDFLLFSVLQLCFLALCVCVCVCVYTCAQCVGIFYSFSFYFQILLVPHISIHNAIMFWPLNWNFSSAASRATCFANVSTEWLHSPAPICADRYTWMCVQVCAHIGTTAFINPLIRCNEHISSPTTNGWVRGPAQARRPGGGFSLAAFSGSQPFYRFNNKRSGEGGIGD